MNEHRQRLHERFLKNGIAGFLNHDAVELLLTAILPESDVQRIAATLLEKFGCLRGILDAPLKDLQLVEGVDGPCAIALHIIREVAGLYLRETAEARDRLA